jgi:hypothetical protein
MDDKQAERLLEEMAKIPEQGRLYPRESIRTAAIAELSKRSIWKLVMNYRVPAYQLAAAVILVFLGFAGITLFHTGEPVKENVVILNPQPKDYGLIRSSKVQIGMNIRQDGLKTLCDSLLM